MGNQGLVYVGAVVEVSVCIYARQVCSLGFVSPWRMYICMHMASVVHAILRRAAQLRGVLRRQCFLLISFCATCLAKASLQLCPVLVGMSAMFMSQAMQVRHTPHRSVTVNKSMTWPETWGDCARHCTATWCCRHAIQCPIPLPPAPHAHAHTHA